MSHSQSKTWSSSSHLEKQRFNRLCGLLRHFVPESPFVPRTVQEWMQHRAAMQEIHQQAIRLKIEFREKMRDKSKLLAMNSVFVVRTDEDEKPPLRLRFSASKQHDQFRCCDDRSSVLAIPSIWLPYIRPALDHPIAPWPDKEELRYEGDDRSKSGVGRYLPLPRKPGNETVTWKAREQAFPISDLDWTGPIKFDPQDNTWAPTYSPLDDACGIPYDETFGILDTGEEWLDPIGELWKEL
ncbi:MAG: hypothetical protein Q9227_006437 [Pyrenula ochraceoflavens]